MRASGRMTLERGTLLARCLPALIWIKIKGEHHHRPIVP